MYPPDPSVTERLLAWFADNGRRLPWRQPRPHGAPRDPYRVWVAEIMLQQTQVGTVIPYYRAFLERFPSVRALAAASQDEVLKAWEGMGYYARARNLHRAARLVQSRHGGHIPGTRPGLLALPGVGEYTAGAILSLAFAQDTPALDANARRVLARLCALDDLLDRPAALRQLTAAAEALMPAGQGGAFNEALMDLGAQVCTSAAPSCPICPLGAACRALMLGRVAEIPARRPRRAIPHYEVTAAVIWQAGKLLLTQRREDKMLGGLWEFPGGKCEAGETLPACLRREICEELALEIEVGEALATVRHAYTHLRITLHAFECRVVAGTPQALGCQDWRWIEVGELGAFALSAVDQRIADAVRRRVGEQGEP